jgi:hypothetical protein
MQGKGYTSHGDMMRESTFISNYFPDGTMDDMTLGERLSMMNSLRRGKDPTLTMGMSRYSVNRQENYAEKMDILTRVDNVRYNPDYDMTPNLYGNPISIDIEERKIKRTKMDLIAMSYNLITLNVTNFNTGNIEVILGKPTDVEFFVSSKHVNPGLPYNYESSHRNTDRFNIYYAKWNFNFLYIKVLGYENCYLDLAIQGMNSDKKFGNSLRKHIVAAAGGSIDGSKTARAMGKTYNSVIPNPKHLKLNQIARVPYSQRMDSEESAFNYTGDMRKNILMTYDNLLREIHDIDIFGEEDYGDKFLPRGKEKGSDDFVVKNQESQRKYTFFHKKWVCREMSMTDKSRAIEARQRQKSERFSDIAKKEASIARHGQLKIVREHREQKLIKWFSDTNWIYLIRVLEFLDHIWQKFRKAKMIKIQERTQLRLTVKLQDNIKRWLDRRAWCMPPAMRNLKTISLGLQVYIGVKRPQINENSTKTLGDFFHRTFMPLMAVKRIGLLMTTVYRIQSSFRKHMKWKRRTMERFQSVIESEFLKCKEWQVYRRGILSKKKMPKETFVVNPSMQILNMLSLQSFSNYMIDLELLNFIDTKFRFQQSRLAKFEKEKRARLEKMKVKREAEKKKRVEALMLAQKNAGGE